MKFKLSIFILFLASSVFADDFLKKLPFSEETLKEVVEVKKEGAAEYLCSIYFPEKPDQLISLLGNGKFRVRRWAKEVLALNADFKDALEKLSSSSSDPEISMNSKEALKNIGKFNEKLHNRLKPVLSIIVQAEGDYKGKEHFSKIYGQWILSTGFELDSYLKNFKPNADAILGFIESGTLDDTNKNKLLEYFKKSKPGVHKVLLAKKLAPGIDLNVADIIQKVDELSSWSPRDLTKHSDAIKEREDFAENRLTYVWKFIEHNDDKVVAVGMYLLQDDPDDFMPEVLKIIKNAKETYTSSSARAISKFKGFKKLFKPHINDLFASKSRDYMELAVELVKDNPEPYLNKLYDIASKVNSSDLEKLLTKVIAKKLSVDQLKKKLMEQEFESKGNNRLIFRFANALKEKKYKADEELNAHIRKMTPGDDYRKAQLAKLIHAVKGDPNHAFELYLECEEKNYFHSDVRKFILKQNTHEKFKDYMLNSHIITYSDTVEFLDKFPGSLENSLERSILAVKKDEYPWATNYLKKGYKALHEQGKLKAFYERIKDKLSAYQKLHISYYLVLAGEEIRDNGFFNSLQTLDGRAEVFRDVAYLQILSKRSEQELLPSLREFLSNKKELYNHDFYFLYTLGEEHSQYLRGFLNELSNSTTDKARYFWATAVNCIEPGHKKAVQAMLEICRKHGERHGRHAFRTLSLMGLEPELSKDEILAALKQSNFNAWHFEKSEKNMPEVRKVGLKYAEKILKENYYYLDEYIKGDEKFAGEMFKVIYKHINKGNGKRDWNCAYLMSYFPDQIDAVKLHEFIKNTDHKSALHSFVWSAARKGKDSRMSWELIQKRLAEKKFESKPHLYFCGARMSDKAEERREHLKNLIEHIKKNGKAKSLQYDVRKLKLITEFDDLTLPFFREIIESKDYDKNEKREAFWAIEKKGFSEDTVKYFSQHINFKTYDVLIDIAKKYPKELESFLPEIKKLVFFDKSKLFDLYELRLTSYKVAANSQ